MTKLIQLHAPNPALGPDPARADAMQDDQGMGATVHDLFAAHAMAALTLHPECHYNTCKELSAKAWALADAMLRERVNHQAVTYSTPALADDGSED